MKENSNTFQNKYGAWAVISGASSGIGRALVLECAQQGLNILMVGRNQDSLLELSSEISRNYSLRTHITVADLETGEGVDKVIKDAEPLEVGLFIHAAGMESHGSFLKNEVGAALKLLDINVKSTLMLTHYFAKKLAAKGAGGILLVSSLSGHLVSPYFANYASSKSYILSLGLSLRYELKNKGVDVSVLSPGLTETPMAQQIGKDIDWAKTPMKIMPANEVARFAIQNFPAKANIVPGKSNRITAFMAGKLFPKFFGKQNESMIRKAFSNQTAV